MESLKFIPLVEPLPSLLKVLVAATAGFTTLRSSIQLFVRRFHFQKLFVHLRFLLFMQTSVRKCLPRLIVQRHALSVLSFHC